MSDITGRLAAAYDKVKEWPENSETGFMDLITLRNLVPEAVSELNRLREENERVREVLKDSYWEASVYHCPPPRNKRDNPLRHSASIRLSGKFATEAAALSFAESAIASGWASNYIVHRESASPSASIVISRSDINKIGRALSPVEERKS